MATVGVSVIARGRIGWILAMVVGIVLLIVGLVAHVTFLAIAGGAFALLGLIFLILSFVTDGRSD